MSTTIEVNVLRDYKKGDYIHINTVLAILEAKLPPEAYPRVELEVRRLVDKAMS